MLSVTPVRRPQAYTYTLHAYTERCSEQVGSNHAHSFILLLSLMGWPTMYLALYLAYLHNIARS